MREDMKLLPQAAAMLGDVLVHDEAIERAHAHLNVERVEVVRPALPRGRPPGADRVALPPRIVLKKLSLRHKQAISLVLQGMSREDAAEATSFVPEYITFLLQQPLAKEYIAHVNRAVSSQLEALYGKSVEAIAGGLTATDPDVKLRAAKLQLQTTGRLEPDETGRKTAEDVVSAMLLGVQVNINSQGRG